MTYGIYIVRIFDTNGIIAKIPNDCTTPDYEVIFGSFKIGDLKLDKNRSVDKNFIWIDNDELLNDNENACSPYYHDFYYIFEGNIVGYDSESGEKNAEIVNPKLKMESVKVIDELSIYIYLMLSIVAIINLTLIIRNFIKTKRGIKIGGKTV